MYFLCAVICVHVLSAHFEFLVLIFDYPVAADWQQTHHFSDFAEKIIVYDHCTLCNLLWTLHFRRCRFLLGLYCGGWVLVTENVVLFQTFFAGLTATFGRFFVGIFVKHAVILGDLSCYFLLVIFDFGHKSQIDKSAHLPILIFRPNIFLRLFTFELLVGMG